MKIPSFYKLQCVLFITLQFFYAFPQANDLSEGPYDQLIIRGITLINGNGAPPIGPVDIEVKKNIITKVQVVGYPGIKKRSSGPILKSGGKEIDGSEMYILPGLIDMHGHIGGKSQGADPDYVFKLWMAHGITTIRQPSGLTPELTLSLKKQSEENSIIAPRIYAYTGFGSGSDINTPEEAKEWVRKNAKMGFDGIKFFGSDPKIMKAALSENKKIGLRSAMHHAQMRVVGWNVLNSARAGLTSMEHWYGLPEALFEDRTIQNYPPNYNYQNEQHRFEEAGKLWNQAAPPFSEKWNDVMNELIELDFTIVPTFNIYEASRDLHRARRAEWHETYTLPSLWKFYEPSKISHGSYWHYWGTEQEVAWKNNYNLWMTFVNEFKNRGGRVVAGSDSGFIYQLYGFGFIRELELLREAGFYPLEIIKSATLDAAEALGATEKIGSIEVGKLADFLIVEENPLENLKVLYGTGAIKLNDKNEIKRVGGVKYTVKDGIIYDSKKLLEDVKNTVAKAKLINNFKIVQPGL